MLFNVLQRKIENKSDLKSEFHFQSNGNYLQKFEKLSKSRKENSLKCTLNNRKHFQKAHGFVCE